MSDPPQSDYPILSELLARARSFPRVAPHEPMPEVWQRTMELRFCRGVLEQAWRSPDSRTEWRAIPVVLYDGPPDPGG